MTNGILFDRVYELRVGKNNSASAIVIESPQEGSGLRIVFEIQKTTSDNPNTSEIRVYNLAAATRSLLEEPGVVVQLYAGYRQAGGLVLLHSGDVVFAYTRRVGPEVETVLQLADGHSALRDTMLTVALRQGGKAKDAIKSIAKQFGMPLSMSDDVLDRAWKHGFSYSGLAKTGLRQISRATGIEWSVQNGTLQVINVGGVTSKEAIVIGSDSGMISSPERLREGSQVAAAVVDQDSPSKAKDVKYLTGLRLRFNGWRVKTLLRPSLNPGDPVSLISEAVQGTFRVDNIRHTGDTHGGVWQSTLDLLSPDNWAVSQAASTQKASRQAVSQARALNRAKKNAAR